MVAAVALGAALYGAGAFAYTAYVPLMNEDAVLILDTTTRRELARLPVGGEPWNAVGNAAGTRAYVANTTGGAANGSVSVIDTTVVPPVVTATIPINGALSVAVSPDSRWIYVGTNYSVTKIDAQTNTVVKTVGVGAGVWDVVVSPDGQRVYAVLGMAGVDGLWAYNADDLSQLWEVNLYTDHPMSVGLSSDGATAYISATNYAGFAEINTATGTFIKRPFVGQANGVAIHPAGHTVYNVGGSTLKSMDTTTHVVTYTPIPTAGDLYGISVTPDGAELYISTWGDEMHVVNAQTRTLLHTYALSGGPFPVSKFIGPAIAAAGLPAASKAVPALSPWAMGLLGAVLAGAGWRSQRRRHGRHERPRGAA